MIGLFWIGSLVSLLSPGDSAVYIHLSCLMCNRPGQWCFSLCVVTVLLVPVGDHRVVCSSLVLLPSEFFFNCIYVETIMNELPATENCLCIVAAKYTYQ